MVYRNGHVTFENIVGKGENAGNQHFLLFPQCFQYVPNTDVYRNFSWDDQSLSLAIVQDFSVVQTDFQSPWATGRVLVFIPALGKIMARREIACTEVYMVTMKFIYCAPSGIILYLFVYIKVNSRQQIIEMDRKRCGKRRNCFGMC